MTENFLLKLLIQKIHYEITTGVQKELWNVLILMYINHEKLITLVGNIIH
jgi:hypothetical protein